MHGEKQPREVRAIEVQSPLLDARDRLSRYRFDDVPQDSVWWKGVELSMLYGYLDPASDVIYGVDNEMHWLEVRDAMRRAFGRMEFPPREALGHGDRRRVRRVARRAFQGRARDACAAA